MRVQSRGGEDPLEESTANALQYSCLENPIGRGALGATVQGVAKCWHNCSTHAHTYMYLFFFKSFSHLGY